MKNKFFANLKAWIDGEVIFFDADAYIQNRKKPKKINFNEILNVNKIKEHERIYPMLCLSVCLIFIGIMLQVVAALPEFGNSNNPVHNEVMVRYLEQGIEETGAINFVTGMILDYRAFDTFAEANVLFLAVMCGVLLLRRDKDHIYEKDDKEVAEEEFIAKQERSIILQTGVKLICPVVILYGIYIIVNGHLSPGGGFSGGAIIGGGLILYATAHGKEKMQLFFRMETFISLSVGSLLVYFACKCYSFFTGANHIGYSMPKGTAGDILSGGFILPLNICVGIVVACTVYGFYALFTRGDI